MKGRAYELDLLRFIAAFAVVLYHRIWTDGPQWLTAATQLGYLGVHVFFMISGFVILWTAMGRTPWEFLASRISRLFPSFWVGLAITCTLFAIFREPVPMQQWVANATMFPTQFNAEDVDPVYWTLTTEWKFYAIVFALIVLKQMKRIDAWLWVWMAGCVATLFLPPNFLLKQLTLSGYASLFILGCVAYLIKQEMSLGRIGLFVCAMAVSVQHAFMAGTYVPTHNLPSAVIISVACFAFLAFALGWIKLPKWQGWYWLGAMTYPVYLVHYKPMDVLAGLWPGNSGLEKFVLIALAYALALVMVLTIERPVCRWAHQWLLRPRLYRRNETGAMTGQ